MITVNGVELEIVSSLTKEVLNLIELHDTQSSLDRAMAEAEATYSDKSLGFMLHYAYDNGKWEYHALNRDILKYLLNDKVEESPTEVPTETPEESVNIDIKDSIEVTKGTDTKENVTLKSSKEVKKVRVHFSTSGPGSITYKMSDSLGSPYEFKDNGEWGPEEGFDMPEGYEATTEVTFNADTVGEYEVTIQVKSVDTQEVISEAKSSITVTE